MKKNGILNRDIAAVLAKIGHTDTIVIADCGLPVPDNVPCIDVSLKLGTPGFIEVLETIASDMEIEHITLAEEMKTQNSILHTQVFSLLPSASYAYSQHETFKLKTAESKVVIRTGEATPFANIILHAGVIF